MSPLAKTISLQETLMPAKGVCGRCGGEATFYPTVVGGEPRRIEAMLICACCSFAACTHRCPFVDAEGVQCRARYGHATLRSLPEGMLHDCRRVDNIRVAEYGGRFVPGRGRDQMSLAWMAGFLTAHRGANTHDAAAHWREQSRLQRQYRRQQRSARA